MEEVDICEIIIKAKKGDKEAKNIIIKENMKYVIKIVNYFCKNNKKLNKEDLIQDGVIAIINSINSYDKSKNVKFSTHAYNTINFSLISEIKRKYSFFKMPEHLVSSVVDFKKKREKMDMEQCSTEDISKKMGLSIDEYKRMTELYNLKDVLSLDSPMFLEDNGCSFYDNLYFEDTGYIEIENKLEVEYIFNQFKNTLSSLEKNILIENLIKNKTVKAIAEEININSKKVSAIKGLALKKIRYSCEKSHKLDSL